LNIALVILHADPAKGGAERYTFDLAAALAGRGHAVTLIASTFGPHPPGAKCVELRERGLTRLGRYRGFLEDLDRHLDTDRYEVVHAMLPVRRCDVYHPHAGLAADAIERGHLKHAGAVKRALAKVGNRVNVKRNAFARVERALLDNARPPVVLCLSEYVKETVRRHYRNLTGDRLATLFNAVDLARFDPASADGGDVRTRFGLDGRVVALMIAQDFERKGLREAIEALAAVRGGIGRAPQAERLKDGAAPVLLVVGKGDVESYRARARALGVADDVIFAGATTDPRSFYAAADFLVLPTRHDPCSLVVLESLAMGVPVISTKQNGACEIMTPGEHGFVLDSADDAAGLAAAIAALCDADARARMRRACLALRPRLAYGEHLDQLLRAYEMARSRPHVI
jgi:UDP-glucose:(heptosyl)LPS alpha-1,3-glucosyltransferase